jgi:hypothetical protein
MVVIHRAVVAIVVMFLRGGCVLMIVAAGIGRLVTDRDPAGVGSEDAGVEPGQRANHHQPCEQRSHQRAENR